MSDPPPSSSGSGWGSRLGNILSSLKNGLLSSSTSTSSTTTAAAAAAAASTSAAVRSHADSKHSSGWMKKAVFGGIAAIGLFYGALALLQRHIIYLPRRYAVSVFTPAEQAQTYEAMQKFLYTRYDGTTIRFRTELHNDQFAYHVRGPHASHHTDTRRDVWTMFGGNAGLALDWAWELRSFFSSQGDIESAVHAHTSFLLVDYPGYGANAGTPSPDGVRQNAQTAVRAAQEQVLGPHRLNVMAHSLGCHAALSVAAAFPTETRRVLLLAPFTRLSDVAKRIVGPLPGLRMLLRHEYDNLDLLETIVDRRTEIFANSHDAKQATDKMEVVIVHGTRDNIVPVEHGRALSRSISDERLQAANMKVEYVEFEHAEHNDIVGAASTVIYGAWKQGANELQQQEQEQEQQQI
jgi:uncharacterized protein